MRVGEGKGGRDGGGERKGEGDGTRREAWKEREEARRGRERGGEGQRERGGEPSQRCDLRAAFSLSVGTFVSPPKCQAA